MATDQMLSLNLNAYPHGQLPSNSHHRFPIPTVIMVINRPRYCTTYKRQPLTCSSSSNVSRFVIANAMASSEMLISTAEQPIYKGGSSVLTPFHADQTTLDAGSLLFVVENILKQAVHMADTALLGTQDYLEKLDEKVSKANFSPRLLCTIKHFFALDKLMILSELLVSAQKIRVPLNLQEMQKVLCNKQIEMPKEVVKAFTGLDFAENNLQRHSTDGSTNKMDKQLGIVMENDQHGEVLQHPNAFPTIIGWLWGMNAFAFSGSWRRVPGRLIRSILPGEKRVLYTFYYASMNGAWLDEFYKKATVVANDPFIKESKSISIRFCRIADHWREEEVLRSANENGWGSECPMFLHDDQYSSHIGHFALVKNESKVVLQDSGTKILKALGDFKEHWRKDLPYRNFEYSLTDHYKKLS